MKEMLAMPSDVLEINYNTLCICSLIFVGVGLLSICAWFLLAY